MAAASSACSCIPTLVQLGRRSSPGAPAIATEKTLLMAEGPRRSKRVIKLNINEEFSYEGSINFLNQAGNIAEVRPRPLRTYEHIIPAVSSNLPHREEPAIVTSRGWPGLHYLPFYLNENINSIEYANQDISGGSRSLNIHSPRTRLYSYADETVQYSEIDGNDNNTRRRSISSSRYDFLEGNSFMSVSPFTMSSDAECSDNAAKEPQVNSVNHNFCKCKQGKTCSVCTSPKGSDLNTTLQLLIGKIDQLSGEVATMHTEFNTQKQRISNLEANSIVSSGDEAGSVEGVSNLLAHTKPASGKAELGKAAAKEVRLQEEKDRAVEIMLGQVNRSRGLDTTQTEDTASDIFDLHELDSKSRKKKDKSYHSRNSPKKQSKGRDVSSEGYSEFSSSSGESSEVGRKHRRRAVKSGARIKTRPVVKTELWPHTVSNEEYGGETTSQDIGLAIFLSCFTCIMVKCGKVESAGRALLLHAVCKVFECLTWAEARTFHNLIMIKLEQDKIDWNSDFKKLADQYLDNKVRLSMKARGSSTGNSSGYRQYSSKSPGKGVGGDFSNSSGNKFNSNASKNKSLYPIICRQWNYGTCSYGEKCKKFHVCWSCAEAGKLGEQHMASSHDTASGRGTK